MEIILFGLLVAIPNLVADFGAFFVALWAEKRFRNVYPHFLQRLFLALGIYFGLQVILFIFVNFIAKVSYLSGQAGAAIHATLVPIINPYTSALYLGLPILLFVLLLLRRNRYKADPSFQPRTTWQSFAVLVLIFLIGIGIPGYLIFSSYQQAQKMQSILEKLEANNPDLQLPSR